MEKIEKRTAEEMLNFFWNTHLKNFISAWINIDIFKGMEPNEVVGERAGPPMAKGQMPMRIEVKAKEAIEQEKRRLTAQARILVSTIKRVEDLKKIKKIEDLIQSICQSK